MKEASCKMAEISRVTRSKEEAKANYDRLSKWYDTLAGRFEKKYTTAALEKLSVKEGEIVLEIGFGTGHCMLALAQSVGNSGKVYGIDISEGMCNIARSRINKTGLSRRVELKCGDSAILPFSNNLFDAIFMSFTLELFDSPEIPNVLRECRRVLHNGGRICVIAMSKKGRPTAMMGLYEWAHSKFPCYFDCRPIFVQKALENSAFQILDSSEMSMWTLPVDIVVARKP
ncbi:MAG: 2-heptaprenyl-1,4-naphthoquinone methyltransferase [Nitrospira bacterium SG8_3]|nr:MAG: 2-heptaprenyl-1,4-naphthoquinone methyltransferase [Nitrospira bacterium SG8_3]